MHQTIYRTASCCALKDGGHELLQFAIATDKRGPKHELSTVR